MYRWIATIALGLAVTGCVTLDTGKAAPYRDNQFAKQRLVMPAGAPSMTQQIYVPRDTGQADGHRHMGIDIGAEIGTPIIAPAAGVVVKSFHGPMYGHQVYIRHGQGSDGHVVESNLVHLDTRAVKAGDQVARGQVIGTLGTSGALSQGYPHLHMEIYQRIAPSRAEVVDPNTMWLDGVGRITCFDPAKHENDVSGMLTYPLGCE